MHPRFGLGPLLTLALGCGTANPHASGAQTPVPAQPAPSPPPSAAKPSTSGEVASGAAALSDWTGDAPGVRRKLTLADLPAPHATKSVKNHPSETDPPEGACACSATQTVTAGRS
jgi:hypothetical protein